MALVRDILQRGNRASQPLATTVIIGTLYGVTDEDNIIERSNGTVWQAYTPTPASPTSAEYLTLAPAAGLSDERVFTNGTNLTSVDGGAGSTYVVNAAATTFSLPGSITPTQITSNQNNYNPTGLATVSTINVSSDASRNVTGLAGGADGRIVIVYNNGTEDIVLVNESASSTAGNRFSLSQDITLEGKHCCILRYNSASSRWKSIAEPALTPGGMFTQDKALNLISFRG